MSTHEETLTIKVNVLNGHELTGEYHSMPVYPGCLGQIAARLYTRKLHPPTPPYGWELTGEYRKPKSGDVWLDPSNGVCDDSGKQFND